MVFARGPILALSLGINYVKISKSACVYRIALDLAVTGLLNVELVQIMKFDIARIKAVECFDVSAAFLTFCLYFYHFNKKLSYRRGTQRCVVSVEILPIAMQQDRNYLYDKSWTNRSYEVGGLRWADV